MAARECNADGCGATVPMQMLYCPKHWTRLPAFLRRALRRASTDGTVSEFGALLDEAQNVLDLGGA